MDLWRFRTFPWLELIQELSEQCLDCPSKQLEHLLTGAGDELNRLEQQLGPTDLWFGEPLNEQVGKWMQAQFKAAAKYVRSSEDGLTRGDSGPFVRLRVGCQSAWAQTEAVNDNANPTWPDSQFLLGAPFREGVLELEVRDDEQGKSEPIGVLMLGFRDLNPGMWHSVRKALCAPKGQSKKAPLLHIGESMLIKGNPSDGAKDVLGFLELEMQYANEMEQILTLSREISTPPQTDTD